MCFLSKACFTDPFLLALFDRLPQQAGTCVLTGTENAAVVDPSNNNTYMPMRALARYYLN